MLDDLEAMGAPADVIAQFKQDDIDDAEFAVFPENWSALNLFLRMDTQWRTSLVPAGGGFMNRPTGLDYTALESLMRIQGIKDTADAFDRIRIMELAALEAMSEQ